jgi:hypothetical protein
MHDATRHTPEDDERLSCHDAAQLVLLAALLPLNLTAWAGLSAFRDAVPSSVALAASLVLGLSAVVWATSFYGWLRGSGCGERSPHGSFVHGPRAGHGRARVSRSTTGARLCALLRRLAVDCRRRPGPYVPERSGGGAGRPDLATGRSDPGPDRPPQSRRGPASAWTRLATVLAVAAAVAAPAAAQERERLEGLTFLDTGPLRIRDQLLIGMAFLSVEPESADVLGRGEWQIDLVQSVTNTWVHSDSAERFLEARDERAPLTLEELRSIEPDGSDRGLYHVDGELYRTSLAVRRGIGRGVQLSVTVPVLGLEGGFGDGTIESFHDTFGFGQAGRKGTFRDDYLVYVRDAEGNELYRPDAPGFGLSDVSLGVKARLRAPSQWRMAIAGTVKLPTGSEDELTGSGSVDVGVQVLGTRYFARSCIHAALAVARLGESQLLGDQTVVSAMVGYEHALGSRTSVVAQGTISQSPYGDLDIRELDDIAYLVDLGVKRGLSEKTVVFAALSENVVNFGSSIDVGLHLGVTRTVR